MFSFILESQRISAATSDESQRIEVISCDRSTGIFGETSARGKASQSICRKSS